MALQGTIDAFPLTDVLQLLSSSTRTGRLMLDGDRGHADLWLDEGSVVGGDTATPSDSAAQLVFEMLRFTDGAFVFDGPIAPDAVPSHSVVPTTLDDCLVEAAVPARGVVADRSGPAIVHHMDPPRRGAAGVVDHGERRRVATARGGGGGVRPPPVGRTARNGEFDTSSADRAMVERSMLVIDAPSPGHGADGRGLGGTPSGWRSSMTRTVLPTAGSPRPRATPRRVQEEPVTEDSSFPERFPIDDLLNDEGAAPGGSWSEGSRRGSHGSLRPSPSSRSGPRRSRTRRSPAPTTTCRAAPQRHGTTWWPGSIPRPAPDRPGPAVASTGDGQMRSTAQPTASTTPPMRSCVRCRG